jgi:PEP-CTERM motif
LFPILAGLNDIQLTFDAMMSGGQGFDFNYAVAGIAQTPLPASWTMMLSGLGAVYLLGWIRKRKAAAI